MGEGLPGGVLAARVLDADGAHAALLKAGATCDLEGTLAQAAEILQSRFNAGFVAVCVLRHGRRFFTAPSDGRFSIQSFFPGGDDFIDREFLARFTREDSGLAADLEATPNRSPGQEAAFAAGIRSSMWTSLRDERGSAIGFLLVCFTAPNVISTPDVDELRKFGAALAWFARPAMLLEDQAAERQLLGREAALLAAMVEAETEAELIDRVSHGVLEALDADLVLMMVESPAGSATLRSAPATALSETQWAAAREALRSGKNGPFSDRSRTAGAFALADLDTAETPLEEWMRESLGMNALAAATRSHHWGGLGLGIAALRRRPGGWTEAQRTFLARLARVFEISVERLRRGEIAIDHALRLEEQADILGLGNELLEILSSAANLEPACDEVSLRLRTFFGADHVAFGLLNLEQRRRTILGYSSDVVRRDEFSSYLTESDARTYADLRDGRAQLYRDLREDEFLSDASRTMLKREVLSLVRAPFRLSDGTLGVVSLGSTQAGRYSEIDSARLVDLCRPLGIAIDRARLLAHMSRTSELMAAKTRVLAALAPSSTIESAGAAFVAEVRRIFGAVHSVAALFEHGEVRIAGIASDLIGPEQLHEAMTSGELNSAWRRVLQHGEVQLVRDLEVVVRTPGEQTLYAGGLRTMMRVPIRDSQGRLRGLVTAGSTRAFCWDDHDLRSFAELGQSLGLVFERAELYQAANERSAKVQALTRLLNTLNLNSVPAEVARLFSAQVREYLSADAVMVYAFDQEAGLRIRVAFDAKAGVARTADRVILSESNGYQGTLQTPKSSYDSMAPDEAPVWLREAASAMGYGSAVCVRLDVSGVAVGMIAAGSLEPGRMSGPELEILAAVAAPLGMVLERARAVTSLRLQTQRTQAVLDILAALGPADTLEEVAAPVANALRLMYSADHCAIGSIEGEVVTLVAVESSITDWKTGDRATRESLLGPDSPAGPVIHVIGDLTAAQSVSELSGVSRDGGMRSSMRVLFGTAADPLGVVTVGSRTAGRFTDFDARQLAQIVQPLTVAARYFRGKREAELRTERLEATNRILTRLSAGGTSEHLALGFLAECRLLFGSVHAVAVQFDHETGTGRLLAVDTELTTPDELPDEFALEDMHSARLVAQPTPELVVDARTAPALNARHVHLISCGVYSAIRSPLVVHDTVRGAISLWGEGAGAFDAEDAELLGTLTRPLALALEKASALESLAESELKYRSLVAQADEMIFVFDPRTLRVLDANSFTSEALGYEPEEITRLGLDQIMDAHLDEISLKVAAAVTDGELHLSDARFLRMDGQTIDVEAVASMVTFGGRQAVLVLARDVSERKALLRQLIQSQKMDSLGAMAGAVAHDFNNLLTTILGFAGLLKRSRNLDTEERENLALIEDAARRAADLTGRLLSFSRGGLVRFGKVDLRTVMEDTLKLTEPTMHSQLRVTRTMPAGPVHVEGDAGQLQQALTNIVLNASDAMPEGGDIALTLAIEGAVAVVRIADNGPGMDEETRMRIFEPFYTTKPVGSGTGLGMAITYGIIQGHHGDIAVASQAGAGTAFTISLPLLDYADDEEPMDLFNAGEGNLVLVVDDDAMVRRTTTATLAELGYNVVEAPGGSTAVEILRARPDRFSVVLLDLVMPGMTGSETFRALTAIRPDLPVVVCTGYAADSHIDTDVKRRIAGLVQKPFTPERLMRALLAAGAQPARASRI